MFTNFKSDMREAGRLAGQCLRGAAVAGLAAALLWPSGPGLAVGVGLVLFFTVR